MRFMMLVKADADCEAGAMPSAEALEALVTFNRTLVEAGVLVACERLRPSSAGIRVAFENGRPTVTDGPFAETKELVGGYWMIEVGSFDEALEWARRVPFQQGRIELRPLAEDFRDAVMPDPGDPVEPGEPGGSTRETAEENV